MMNILNKYPVASIIIVVLLMLLFHLDIPNVTIMEARNFITAREMVVENNWLLTTMNGEARYQKPPLPTWLTAISGLIFGMQNLFGLRLPAALMVMFLGVFSYLFSLKLTLSKNHSLWNGLIVVSSFYVIGIINEAPWDIFTHGFMMAGLFYLFHFFEQNKANLKTAIYASLFIGASILSKGPISLYALFLPFLISYFTVFKFQNLKNKIIPFISIIILGFVIGGWWFVYVRVADPEAFIAIATKETGNWSSYNVKPFYYYWSFFTQSGLWTIPALIGLIYPYMIKRVQNKKIYKFTFWWTITAVILLSVIPEKKARYLMPVLIPLALNTGFYIHYITKRFNFLKLKEKLPIYVHFGIIVIACVVIPIGAYFIVQDNFSSYIFSFILTCISCFLIGVLIITSKVDKAFLMTVMFMLSLGLFALPMTQELNDNDNFSSIKTLQILESKENFQSYAIGDISPEFVWDYQGVLKNIYRNEVLTLPKEDTFGLLILNSQVEQITTVLSKNFNLKHIQTFDQNVGSKRKERLIRQFYLISKK